MGLAHQWHQWCLTDMQNGPTSEQLFMKSDHKSEHVERCINAKLTRMGIIFAVFVWLQAPSHVWRCFSESKTSLSISELWWNSASCFRVETDRPRSMCPRADKQTPQKETSIEKEETSRAPRSRNSERASWHALLALQNQGPWPQLQQCCCTMLHAISPSFVFVWFLPCNWCGLWRKEGRGMWKSEMSCYHHATAGGQGKQGHTDQTDTSMQCISLLW